MMGTEDKTLLCFCHWGRMNKVLPDGSISCGGGITDQVIVKTGIKYNDFVNAIFDRLGIDPSDKILHFTVKFDRSKLIRLRDQEGVDVLLQFNDGYAHVYAASLEEEPNSTPPSGGAEKVEPIVSDSEPDTTPMYDDEKDLASPLKKAECIPSAGDSNPLKEAMAHQSAGESESQQKEAIGGREVLNGKGHNKVDKLRPSDNELRSAVCETLKEIDFNTATFPDIMKILAKRYDTDLTPRKSSVKRMIRDELTRSADEADEAFCPRCRGLKA